jgi:hypothetical protein
MYRSRALVAPRLAVLVGQVPNPVGLIRIRELDDFLEV